MSFNLFKISKSWFELSFEDYRITPTHTAFMFYIVDLNNRLAWVETFGLPALETCQALNISYNTFRKILKEFIEDFKFITLVQKSTNQYTANIISLDLLYQNLLKLKKSKYKALVKANEKLDTKQSDINKPVIPIKLIKPINLNGQIFDFCLISDKEKITFNYFWNHFHKHIKQPKAKKEPAFKHWKKLTLEQQRKAYNQIAPYSKSKPKSEHEFLCIARTYLSDKLFNDEFKKGSTGFVFNVEEFEKESAKIQSKRK